MELWGARDCWDSVMTTSDKALHFFCWYALSLTLAHIFTPLIAIIVGIVTAWLWEVKDGLICPMNGFDYGVIKIFGLPFADLVGDGFSWKDGVMSTLGTLIGALVYFI